MRRRGISACIVVSLIALGAKSAEEPIMARPPVRLASSDSPLIDETEARLVIALARKARRASVDRFNLVESVAQSAEQNGVDPMLVLAVISVESSFNPEAISARGAKGLMQLKEATAFEYSGKIGTPIGERGLFDETTNVALGSAYLRWCHDRLGSWPLALAAYNWGPARVKRAIQANHGRLPTPMREYGASVKKNYRKFVNAVDQKVEAPSFAAR